MHLSPNKADRRNLELPIGNPFGAVIDKKNETQSKTEEADQAKYEADHGAAVIPRKRVVDQRLLFRLGACNRMEGGEAAQWTKVIRTRHDPAASPLGPLSEWHPIR